MPPEIPHTAHDKQRIRREPGPAARDGDEALAHAALIGTAVTVPITDDLVATVTAARSGERQAGAVVVERQVRATSTPTISGARRP